MRRSLVYGLACSCALTTVHCTSYSTRFEGTTWDDDNWRITTSTLDQGHYQSRISLANGYLGINLAAVGPFFEVDSPVDGDLISGWPLFDRRQTFATIAGFYDSQPTTNGTNFEWLNQYGGESVISGVPHWAGIHIKTAGYLLSASVPAEQISNFVSTLDMGAGMFEWSYTWTPPGSPAIGIEYSMFVHKLYVNQAAVQLKITPSRAINATVIDLLEGDAAVRTAFNAKGYEADQPTIYTSVRPNGIQNVTAYIYSTLAVDDSCTIKTQKNFTDSSIASSNSSTIAQAITLALKAGQTTTITKYIGGASSDAFSNPQDTAKNASLDGSQTGYVDLLASHIEEWESILTKDSVDSFRFSNGSLPDDENIIELQILAVSNPFHLIQNTVGDNAIAEADDNDRLDVNSISVCGLGSDCYAGLIFWDAEVWMAPGLAVSHPAASRQIARYRVDKFPQAQRNVLTAYQSSQNKTGEFSPDGAVYSWTSGRFGNCTGTGPCFDYEYHLNGDIGLELYNYYVVTGNTDFFKDELFPVYDAIAQFYADVITLNTTTGKYDLYNATDPDEYANFQTNVGYTMVLMQTHINTANTLRSRLGLTPNTTWAGISSQITVPVDQQAGLILEYAAMNGSISVKQADVVLVDDFLDYPNPYTLSDLDYYAGKQSPNGPGMTYGVFSIVANAISPSGCSSYTYDIYASRPYVRAPWYQYSEQLEDDYTTNGGTHPAYPFLTGMGGANRVAIFGYLGLKLMLDSLNVDPSLPPQILNLDYRTIYWQGWAINATSNQTHTTISRLDKSLENANSTFADSAIPVTVGLNRTSTYQLPPGGSIVLQNRQIGNVKTWPGNVLQCRPVASNNSYVPGQFPLSAVDGAVSTKWQPTQSNVTSSILIELEEPYSPVSEVRFDWGQAPPQVYYVTFLNDTNNGSTSFIVASDSNVAISSPYSAATASDIVPYQSNTTNATLVKPFYTGKYVRLSITGNRATEGTPDEKNGTGATVAEFALIAVNGSTVQARDVIS
ncbi:hypothetical protein AMS68_000580 [Peltaster fructicola]|uniref:alpha,alpha-trehalase n=1 Tax=Peltaster fructicola TaxID=286661 RepID=A0A6H0XK02_9PEZI|nr:hypothetical protein AMS68_000580 [Peltaster fructicola]